MRPIAKLILYALMMLFAASGTHAIDNGQWENTDPAIREWYREFKMPDAPHVSCCGEADAYYADKVYTKDGKNIRDHGHKARRAAQATPHTSGIGVRHSRSQNEVG